MRWRCAALFAALFCLLPLTFGGGRAVSHVQVVGKPAIAPQLFHQAGIECGTFDGEYTCRYVRGGRQFGKNAPPVPNAVSQEPVPFEQSAPAPSGTWSTEATPGSPDNGSGCKYGMVGTPPNCTCPPNTELLGGNCVRYTASTCSSGIAADALPQACRGVEEKLSCKMRNDGLKDCCCVVYDKF